MSGTCAEWAPYLDAPIKSPTPVATPMDHARAALGRGATLKQAAWRAHMSAADLDLALWREMGRRG